MQCSGSKLKTILYQDQPSIFIHKTSAEKIKKCWPELWALKNVSQPEDGHPEGDVFEHTLQVLDAIAELTLNVGVRYAAFLHDFGKQSTPAEEYPHHYGHEKNSAYYIIKFSRRLGVLPDWEKAALAAARLHMKGHYFFKLRPGTRVDLLTEVKSSPLTLEDFRLILVADARGRGKAGNCSGSYLKEMVEVGREMFERFPSGWLAPERIRQLRCNWMAANSRQRGNRK